MEANGIEEDERPMPRRSSRDPKEIPQSETPDQVAIIAEHFAIEPAPPFFNFSFDSVLDESDEPIIEALFELNDPVTLLALSQEHPDYKRPFKVVARHFNSREYPENNGDDGMDVSSDEKDTHTDNSVTNNLEGDTIDDLLGKIGWFYKLDRNPQSDIAMLPNLVLWHEDDLGLALDDDSGDEDDLDLDDSMEEDIIGEVIAQEVVVKTIVKEEVIEETIVEDIVVTDSNSNA